MDLNSFWLLDLDYSLLSVSLIRLQNNVFSVSVTGPQINYELDQKSIVAAVDSSLSEAAAQINLPEGEEPNSIALILPPFWVGSDGKIVPDKLKLIEYISRDLKLKPMGFICNDDAIVEATNHQEGFPSSFVLINFSLNTITISLAYLGKIIERVNKPLPDPFDPSTIENSLLEFKAESALPPQIILFGNVSDTTLESLRNYSWIGKKNIETFLHFPEIQYYSPTDIVNIYTKAISFQFNPHELEVTEPPIETKSETPPSTLEEVSADMLGFSTSPEEENPPTVDMEPELVIPDSGPEIIIKSKPKFVIPQVKIPRIKLPNVNYLFFLFVLSPLLILIPFFFSTAKIVIYLTPYSYDQKINTTLDPNLTEIDKSSNSIPVKIKTLDVYTTSSVTTTGQKIIGDKAHGEIVVYNKVDKIQTINKNSVLLDNKGNKFILITGGEIASSSSNLDAGVITLGQAKFQIEAQEIGPEYNLPSGTQLHFKDIVESILLAKVKDGLVGGSKSEIKAVSLSDKNNLDKNLQELAASQINAQIKKEQTQIGGAIQDAFIIKSGRIEHNREVGESTDILSGSLTSAVSIFYFSSEQKDQLLNTFLAGLEGFSTTTAKQENFNISLSSPKITNNQIKGSLSITGKSLPFLDTSVIKKKLSGKSLAKAEKIIKQEIPRVYKYQIDRNFTFINWLNPLPYRLQNISIEVK